MATNRNRNPNHHHHHPYEDHNFGSLVYEQRRELMAAETLESDLDFAFRLQLQEALTASMAAQPSSSSAAVPTLGRIRPQNKEAARFASHQSKELAPVEQEIKDWNQSAIEMLRLREDLSRRVHDQMVTRIPNDDWGDIFAKPFGDGSSKIKVRFESDDETRFFDSQSEDEEEYEDDEEAVYRVYFKGLLSEENSGVQNMVMAGIGVALCDPRDNLLFEVRKPLIGKGLSKLGAEAKALIEGLNAAMTLNLKRITLYCDNFTFHQFVSGRWPVKQRKIAVLLDQAKALEGKFAYCNSKYVPRNDIKFAFKLAKDAILSQINRTAESSRSLTLYETCVICMEDTDVSQIFSVKSCLHRYCFPCMKQHVEVKLREAQMPKCPHEGCNIEIDIDSCENFLTPKLLELMCQRVKEAATPVTERVYCPNPRCSFLMSKTEVFEYTKKERFNPLGARKCLKCSSLFCIDCKVLWHQNMTCLTYKRLNPEPSLEDAKLKVLASKNLWRQCRKCNLMIELAHGCYHMTCRCGYEFCYNCGAEWRNKKPTCSCPLWAEDNILYDGNGHLGQLEEEEDDFDDDDDDFDDFDQDFY
ncbi:E3 ubiquitin-protein ligase RSL1-like [Humulus lupulus]|uniref:E3 ubiquitin-protein ligase RSL1-like n=1 Tax=Humulus lupulus TaxID=3486 RepID=UPI002B414BA1|nr:E3 ubiquitin-protein ligase RSL1-like [Humulus lupulus]